MNKRIRWSLLLLVLVAVVDQASKWWITHVVMRPPHEVEVTPFLNFVLVHNKGITFGMLNGGHQEMMPYILSAMAFAVLFLLGRWLWRTTSAPVSVGLAFVMGGAIGNVADRVRYGAVVDFIDFYYRDFHWYAFNVADAAIVTGVGLLLLDSLVRAR